MKKVYFVFPWVIILFVSFAFIAVAGERPNDRRYTLPGHGFFQMKVPVSWKDDVTHPTNDLPPKITLRPAKGDQFIITIIPFWKESEDAPSITDAAARQMVERAADKAQPNAVEKNLNIVELQGSAGRGYYFSATEKPQGEEGSKFLTQGIFLVDELVVTFTILTKDDQGVVSGAAIAMLKNAIHVKEK